MTSFLFSFCTYRNIITTACAQLTFVMALNKSHIHPELHVKISRYFTGLFSSASCNKADPVWEIKKDVMVMSRSTVYFGPSFQFCFVFFWFLNGFLLYLKDRWNQWKKIYTHGHHIVFIRNVFIVWWKRSSQKFSAKSKASLRGLISTHNSHRSSSRANCFFGFFSEEG